jgi:hypothetical protein
LTYTLSEGSTSISNAALPGTLKRHWPLYVFEAAELALFMFSACAFTVFLFDPSVNVVLMPTQYDAIVIGIGAGGGTLALCLAGNAARRKRDRLHM